MFGAGIGVGMLTYSTAEPLAHFANNPDVIMGTTSALGRTACGGLQVDTPPLRSDAMGLLRDRGHVSRLLYRRDVPLTIRSPFTAVLGPETARHVGAVVDAAF